MRTGLRAVRHSIDKADGGPIDHAALDALIAIEWSGIRVSVVQ